MSTAAGTGWVSPHSDGEDGEERGRRVGPRRFEEGERILLVDRKARSYLVRLSAGKAFMSHAGVVEHDLLIGQLEGSEVYPQRRPPRAAQATAPPEPLHEPAALAPRAEPSSDEVPAERAPADSGPPGGAGTDELDLRSPTPPVTDAGELDPAGPAPGLGSRTSPKQAGGTYGERYLALRPTLSDLVLKMPRGAQVIYPKDLGAILIAADIFPGARVLEAGVGSGALSMAMLRAGATLVGYELREDFAGVARRNVAESVGPAAPYVVEIRDIYDGIDLEGLDRIVLDLPEPWRVIDHAAAALLPGGILTSYLPTINQTAELRGELDRSGFKMAETFEVLRRTWHIEGRSVRPDHRMVAHTGFITHARLITRAEAGIGHRPES